MPPVATGLLATAACPSRTGQPFHCGRSETYNQMSQEQEGLWARWHSPRDSERWWQTSGMRHSSAYSQTAGIHDFFG